MAPDLAGELCERTTSGGSDAGADLRNLFRVAESRVVSSRREDGRAEEET